MNKAIFLDRDGTINVEKKYLYKIEDFEFLPGVVEALRKLQDAGFLLIIITNQSGIGRGFYTENDFKKLNNWMVSILKDQGVTINAVYYCPHFPGAKIKKYCKDCECRKPRLGMYNQAIKDYDLDISKCYAVGDKIRDCAICEKTECRGFLIENNEQPDVIEKVNKGKIERIKYSANLKDASELIILNNE